MKKLIGLVLVLGLGFVGGFGYGRWYAVPSQKAQAKAAGYHCPMHPHVKSDHAGQCPICGMELVTDSAAAAVEKKVAYYRDPQQHDYHSDRPGLNPETGNTLEPVYEGEGLVMIPSEKQQWIGLKTGVVERGASVETVRFNGRVAVDETRVTRVQTRLEGWIEKVAVDSTARLVEKGETMLTLYSPELVASQREYLLARQAQEHLGHSMVGGVGASSERMAQAALERLRHHWGLSEEDLKELERTGEPRRTFSVKAPSRGIVLERMAFASQMAKPEMDLFKLADLSKVWILAEVYESDAAQVRPGMAATIEPAYAPGRRMRARVTSIVPQVNTETRTITVRLEAENPDYFLKPDLWVNVDFGFGRGDRLRVPEDAVVDTGRTRIVYVDLGQGRFEPRAVQAGERYEGKVEILAGLKEGERIVTSGAFLVDSESRMRSGSK